MATSHERAQSRKAAIPKAVKAPIARKASAAAKKAAGPKKTTAERKGRTAKTAAKPNKATARAAKQAAIESAARPSALTRSRPTRTPDAAERLHSLVLKALDDLKARDIHEIDVRGKSSVTDLMIVVSGTSSRHTRSIADEVVKQAKHAGLPPIGVEGQREGEWVLVDLGDIVVHVMLPRTREFYGLERLWTVGDDMPDALAG